MRSLDTNVVVRALAEDDDGQSAVAKAAFSDPVFVSEGVFMETEWVMRTRCKWPRQRINEAFAELVRLETVTIRGLVAFRWVLERHRAGADLADMLHIVAAHGSAFLTFDSKLAGQAGPAAPLPVETLA